MLWIIASLFFCWLIYRELTRSILVSKPYLGILIILTLLTAWPVYHRWRFEHLLNSIAQQLAENHLARVHCNTLWDTLFDEDPGVGGHADPQTGYIVIQYPRCDNLMNYSKHPANASKEELYSLNILTHESMHARGEYNEAKTECAAVQRNYQTAILLGVPDAIAKQNALAYYKNYYLHQTGTYFSKDCVPGGVLDEHLNDSIWKEPVLDLQN